MQHKYVEPFTSHSPPTGETSVASWLLFLQTKVVLYRRPRGFHLLSHDSVIGNVQRMHYDVRIENESTYALKYPLFVMVLKKWGKKVS